MNAFEPGLLASIPLKNRFIHSPTHEGLADPETGAVTDEVIALNRELAAGGFALNIVGFTAVHQTGPSLHGMLRADCDACIPGLAKLAQAIREEGCVPFIQLSHAGVHARPHLTGVQARGPSDIESKKGGLARAMTLEEIAEAVTWYADAAARVKAAGFEGIQIHAAHGYLISQFLSPYYNRRTDEYGGTVEKRARFFKEVLAAVREKVGPDYPLICKINSTDFLPPECNGITPQLLAETMKIMEKTSLNGYEISGGCNANEASSSASPLVNPKTIEDEGYFKEGAKACRDAGIKLPLIFCGGLRSLEACNRVLDSGLADFVSISRPAIREPNLINRWKSGDTSRAKCISCNVCAVNCFEVKTHGIVCPFAEKDKRD